MAENSDSSMTVYQLFREFSDDTYDILPEEKNSEINEKNRESKFKNENKDQENDQSPKLQVFKDCNEAYVLSSNENTNCNSPNSSSSEHKKPTTCQRDLIQGTKQIGKESGSKDTERNIYLAVNEKTVFSLHGINTSLPVTCDICMIEFSTMDQFDKHMENHLECRFFSCQLCTKTYISWENLVAHRKVCHRGIVMSCDDCVMRKHHHNLGPVNFPVGEFPVGCEECHAGFKTVIQLYRHYRIHTSGSAIGKVKNCSIEDTSCISTSCDDAEQLTVKITSTALKSSKKALFRNKEDEMKVLHTKQQCSSTLQLHKDMQKEKRNFKCSVCLKVCKSHYLLQNHKKIHENDKPFVCKICHKSFRRKSALNVHKYCHPVSLEYSCFACQIGFLESIDLKKHIEKVHYQQPDVKLKCNICHHNWSVHTFMNHYLECHLDQESRKAVKRQISITCHICCKMFSQPTALNRHLKLHNTERQKYICEVCGIVIQRLNAFILHMRSHYGSTYEMFPRKTKTTCKNRESLESICFICEYCGREFTKKINLQLHLRRHTGERPYHCTSCSKSFYTGQQLSIHLRQHTGERPYSCMLCKKSFTSSTALYSHKKLHNKIYKYTCQYCGKKFFWRTAYIGHIRLHTGIRPYKCDVCSKTFTLKGKLNLHIKKHKEKVNHKCTDCQQNFVTEEELHKHCSEKCCITITCGLNEEINMQGEEIILLNTDNSMCIQNSNNSLITQS